MSNQSLSQFINASAMLMLADRPDLWEDHDDAVLDITMAFEEVLGLDESDFGEYSVHFSGYVLTRVVMDEGTYEYTLSKKLVGLAIFTEDEESHVYDWTKDSQLTDGIELNLPELEDDLDIEPDINDDLNYEEDN